MAADLDPKTTLLFPRLARVVKALDAGTDADLAWEDAHRALELGGESEEEIRRLVATRDEPGLRRLVGEWHAGTRPLPEPDKAVLRRAMKAFKKRLKLTRLDAESSIGGGPMSSGRDSGIVGITPPTQYPREVWDELVRQGRLHDAGHGMLELLSSED